MTKVNLEFPAPYMSIRHWKKKLKTLKTETKPNLSCLAYIRAYLIKLIICLLYLGFCVAGLLKLNFKFSLHFRRNLYVRILV